MKLAFPPKDTNETTRKAMKHGGRVVSYLESGSRVWRFVHYILCLCVCVTAHVEVTGQLVGVGSHLASCGSWR